MAELSGQVFIVTGGAKGKKTGVAKKLAKAGAIVIEIYDMMLWSL
ncbi:hypothetical protein SAMN06265348_11381 [Pedobacter westerhofensis]|uniref:Short chain dehydrogenase n=1 Tax=Pedobacter westerhofensis TaxID=425512 RepID=A0A521FLJ2_9SPHI|nr:hypothetical protein [Pedobacter westerhofensis]SMO96450.1 hypothetical protein SAMN06265348_11381 [Pedobacter westerhofensis]